MKIIAGLGNPGQKYELTRHNAGFMILEYFAHVNNLTFRPGKGDYYYAAGKIRQTEFMLVKPTTYMNNSGLAVLDITESIPEFNLEDLLVVYDDFQLPLGTIRVRKEGSDGGHNGLESIIYHLNTMDFPRMRVGIGTGEVMKKDDFVDFVLSNFTDEEMTCFKEMMPVYKSCIKDFLSEDIKIVMNRYNKNFLKKEEPIKEEPNKEEPKEDSTEENEQKPPDN
ncbi:MAG: aminoacyl-tRNA hydrolase [Ignavibacteria bacterium]|nr:aminoacyl-tRNA hydrolase [Ignavibacteria bacterium]